MKNQICNVLHFLSGALLVGIGALGIHKTELFYRSDSTNLQCESSHLPAGSDSTENTKLIKSHPETECSRTDLLSNAITCCFDSEK
ncbi:MAG: hypothetical protein ABR574_04985 [Cryomorphaceae bacterium]